MPGREPVAFRELTTLQKWIVEGRVNREDEISKSGDRWKRLGSISELEPFFAIFERASELAALPSPEASGIFPAAAIPEASVSQPSAPPPSASVGAMPPPSASMAPTPSSPRRSDPPASPALPSEPELVDDPSPAAGASSFNLPPAAFPGTLSGVPAYTGQLGFSQISPRPAPPAESRTATWLLTAGLVLAGAVAGAFLADGGTARLPEALRAWLPSAKAEKADALQAEAARAADADTATGREQALLLLEKAAEIAPEDEGIRADRALVEVSAAAARLRSAQRLERVAAAARARLDGWEAAMAAHRRGPEPSKPEGPDPEVTLERARKQRAQAERTLEALSERFDGVDDPSGLEHDRALAAYLLAQGNVDALVPHLERVSRGLARVERFDPFIAWVQAAALTSEFSDPSDAQRAEASSLLRAALEARPTMARAKLDLARLLADSGELEAARGLLQPLLGGEDPHPEAIALADQLAPPPSVAEAEPEPAAEPAPAPAPRRERRSSLAASLARADRLRRDGNPEAALDAFGQLAERHPGTPDAILGKGWCFLDLGRPRLALLAFERAAAMSDSPDALLGLGRARLRLGRTESALEALRSYLERAPRRAVERAEVEATVATLARQSAAEATASAP